MTRWLKDSLLLLLVLCLPMAAWAVVVDVPGSPFATEQLSAGYLTQGITSTLCKVGTTETKAMVEIHTASIFYRLDATGATPTSANHIGNVSDVLFVKRPSRFRAISATPGTATAAVTITCIQ